MDIGSDANINIFCQSILNNLPSIAEVGATVPISLPALSTWLDSIQSMGWTTYAGSLTVPPCTEQVMWYQVFYPIQITVDQFDIFKNYLNGGIYNYRPIQRKIEYTDAYHHAGI